MVKALVTPTWHGFPGSPVEYVDRHFADFDAKSLSGTVRDSWKSTQNFLRYLREQRVGELNQPEVYRLLEKNIDHLLAGQPLVWAVDTFGYEQARELKEKPFVPDRDRFYVADNGSRIPTKDPQGNIIGYFGGVTDGTYWTYGLYLGQIIDATFGIMEPRVNQAGKWLSVDEIAELYSRERQRCKIVEREAVD